MTIMFNIVIDRLYSNGHDVTYEMVTEKRLSKLPGDEDFVARDEIVPVFDDYTKIIWNTTTVLTEQECIDEWNMYLAEQSLEAIHEKRRGEYPSYGDQFDMIWHALDNGAITKMPEFQTFYDAIKTVKDNNPLP